MLTLVRTYALVRIHAHTYKLICREARERSQIETRRDLELEVESIVCLHLHLYVAFFEKYKRKFFFLKWHENVIIDIVIILVVIVIGAVILITVFRLVMVVMVVVVVIVLISSLNSFFAIDLPIVVIYVIISRELFSSKNSSS